LIFAAWILGGLLSLAGALANAELGAMFPRAGGDYVYLREAFHPLAGFLIGWLSFIVIYPGTIATLAVAFANSVAPTFGLPPQSAVPMAIAVTVAVSAVNYVGVRWGARVNNLTSYAKIVALVAFALLGPLFGSGHAGNLLPVVAGAGGLSLAALGLAFSPILFSYLGWNASVYVASEIERPERNVPASLFLGLGICTLLYMIVNAVYLFALPIGTLAQTANAGEAAAHALFGPISGRLLSFFVLGSILGTLNATILVGPRIAYAMALDERFFARVDRVHERHQTPHVAIWLQAGVASVLLIVLRSFPSVLGFTTFAIVVLVAILVGLRSRQRRRPVLNYLRDQIQSRPACIDRWGNDIQRRELAELACRVLAKEMSWPNAHFLPDDPVNLLTFNLDGVDEHVEIVMVAHALKKAINRKLSWDKVKLLSGETTTLGNIIDAAI
jgi:APA family basic amino acid/polyamine antiporter